MYILAGLIDLEPTGLHREPTAFESHGLCHAQTIPSQLGQRKEYLVSLRAS
jgi:hypothetical protein